MWTRCGQPVGKCLYLQVIHMCIQPCPQPPVDAPTAPPRRRAGLSTYSQAPTTYYPDISPLAS
nr:MAG TPA: hypothetical protein [Caudoviricetes sp.]